MARNLHQRPLMCGEQPRVDQGHIHGFRASWNPDDNKFYIHAEAPADPQEILGRFARFSNAVQFARKKRLS